RASGQEASQALLFVDIFQRSAVRRPVFWRGRARVPDLLQLAARFLGAERAQQLIAEHPRSNGAEPGVADAQLVQRVETQLAGAIGSASARVMVAAVVEEEPLALDDVMRMLDETSQLRALDRMKDDFMASMSHELRTPLAAIRAVTELMRDDAQMPAAQRAAFLDIVVTETERLGRLVNQVLDMAKIESGHGEWHTNDVDLRELLTHATQATAAMFKERGATLQLQLPDALRTLRTDRDRLLQVLMNLLSNAAKFVPREGGRVELRLRADDAGATVEVQDNGPGVPPEQQALIFEKFHQGGDALNRPQGTGLGLPISRRIVEHFGGRMWLRSQPGQGACFAFFLPWEGAAA
ncbi:MAG TPA: HAMP domain-containing sensor histidine kinase, partial [Albitalea sp.]|nr:HAMP domain-containing sensor histidine kinase [Albitalea sp.]